MFAERSKVLTEAVDLGDGEGDTTTAVGHLPGRGGGEERREEGRGGEERRGVCIHACVSMHGHY